MIKNDHKEDKVYLLKTDLLSESNQVVYKIGRSSQIGLKRFSNYPDTYRLCLVRMCIDSKLMEKELIRHFRTKYTLVRGNEYFAGDVFNMINDINNKLDNESPQNSVTQPVMSSSVSNKPCLRSTPDPIENPILEHQNPPNNKMFDNDIVDCFQLHYIDSNKFMRHCISFFQKYHEIPWKRSDTA